MGFVLETNGERPAHPHLICTGNADLSGRGWAWSDSPRKQKCFSGAHDIAASATLVATAIGPSGIDAMLAIAELATASPGAIRRIFPRVCAACGGNHHERVAQILRSVKYIHPDAVPALRAALVPEKMLRNPFFPDEAIAIPSDRTELQALLNGERGKIARRTLRLRGNIPVWKRDAEKTRIVQIAFAHKYRLKKGL